MPFSARNLSRWILGAFFIAAGINHFLSPEVYVAMIPPALPSPYLLNAFSGAAEILGGVGVFVRPLNRLAGWGLIFLLIAVFPANLYVAIHGWPGVKISEWILWARLPFQLLFIFWVYRALIYKPTKLP